MNTTVQVKYITTEDSQLLNRVTQLSKPPQLFCRFLFPSFFLFLLFAGGHLIARERLGAIVALSFPFCPCRLFLFLLRDIITFTNDALVGYFRYLLGLSVTGIIFVTTNPKVVCMHQLISIQET